MRNPLLKALPQRIFFLIFLAVPLLGGVPVLYAYIKGIESLNYQQAQCYIIRNEWVKSSSGDARLDLEYSYNVGGRDYRFSRYQWGLDNHASERNKDTRRFVKSQTPGEQVDCFINAVLPSDAVIKTGSTHKIYEVVFLSLFLLFGSWGLFVALFYPDWAEENFKMDGDSSGTD